MKSENEEFCRSKFDEFIRENSSIASIRWEDVAQRDEPPDYYLSLDGIKYAVEVTILMDKLKVGNLKLSPLAVIASLWSLVDEVEATAKRNHYLNGAYAVSFSRPIVDFSSIRDQLFDDLLAYVKATQNVSTAPEHFVLEQGAQKCAIQKLHDQKGYIGKVGPSGGKWEVEVAEEICTLLEERVSDKRHKLSKIIEPKVLLLYDAYHFANPEMYRSCLDSLAQLRFFNTIFVVPSNQAGWVLYSENSHWLS